MPLESDLYPPVKTYLEAQGYEVKGEVGAADIVALRAGDPQPVIVELKQRFSLSLFHQAIARLRLSDTVYIAVPRPTGRTARRSLKDNLTLCRRLGIGLITVRARDQRVEVHCDPGPYAPRQSKVKQTRLLREFERLEGDPNTGGSTRRGIITAYRQDAIKVAQFLATHGASKAANVAQKTDVPRARQIMADNHYGWFERVDRGIYALSPAGRHEFTPGNPRPDTPL